MNRIIKNHSKQRVKTIFRGREVYFGSKQAQVFDTEDEEEKALYDFWLKTYEFLQDITVNMKRGDTK